MLHLEAFIKKTDPDLLELPQVGCDVSLIAKTAPDVVFMMKENRILLRILKKDI